MTSDDLRLIPGARVLVADDHERHVELLDGYLSAVGHDCLHAYDGEEALLRSRSDGPELLLLDVGMPRLNGFQVCERVKRHPSLQQGTTRVIAAIEQISAAEDLPKAGGQRHGQEAGAK